MPTILESLYDGELYPAEQLCPYGDDYKAKHETSVKLYDAFRQKLNPSLQKEFDEMFDAQSLVSSVELKQSFISGFQLGSNMMAEILIYK